jgi:diacylglycerol kinase (ATP)
MPNWCIIFNPAAAGHNSGHKLNALCTRLDQAQIAYTVKQTRQAGDGITRCKEALDQHFRHFLVVGGDGTLHEVVNGLMQSESASTSVLALLPAGTGNDFARGWQIPNDLTRHIQALERNESELIDVGYITNSQSSCYFINMAGAGFDAAVALKANQLKSGWLPAQVSYLLALGLTLFRYPQTTVNLNIQGHEEQLPLFSVLCGNGAFAGNGMKLTPGAQFNDGQFYITRVSRISPLKVLFNVHRLFAGSFLRFKEVATFSGQRVHIQADTPVPLQADGEPVGFSPAEIRLIPSALRILRY